MVGGSAERIGRVGHAVQSEGEAFRERGVQR
jgi:hypothetical protein